MLILEAIIGLTIFMVVLSVGLLLLKFAFAMVLLPIKLFFFLTKGLLGLIFVLPLLLIVGALATAVVPLALVLVVLPALILGGVTCSLAGL